MPGRDILGPVESPSPNFALFKSHKSLPRSQTLPNDRRLSDRSAQKPMRVHATETLSAKSSERIRSWIQKPDLTHVALNKELPLTPPIISLDLEDERWMGGPLWSSYISATHPMSPDTGLMPPLIQQSPPTPETTPPKASHDLSPSRAPRDPSLRTGSFETAREHLTSDGEDVSIDSTSLHLARQKWRRDAENMRLKSIGLGLGLESDDEEKFTSTELYRRNIPANSTALKTSCQGVREEADRNNAAAEDPQALENLPPQVMTRIGPQTSTRPMPKSGTTGEGAGSPTLRSLSLRQRLEKAHRYPSPSVEKFAEEIEWPLDEEFDLEARLREIDNRRFSQTSATSTVVEAMVIDTSPQRKQTLRHTGKVSNFKSKSPRVSPSNPSFVIVDNLALQQLPHDSRNPDRRRRRTIATDVSEGAASSPVRARPNAVPLRPRPTTAPHDSVGYFDIPRREGRKLSATAETWIPKLETPTSRNDTVDIDINRALVLATEAYEESFRIAAASSTHGATTTGQPQAVLHLSDPPDIHGVSLDRVRSGEWSALRPRSALFTPFSLRSAHSSTPGTLEVNEATAISIYPHTNKSILVIQEMAGKGSLETSAIIAGNANIAVPMPMPPPVVEPSPPRLHSPLQNPREPPKPPDLKVIPPTPCNGPRTPEADFGSSQFNSKSRLSGTFSVMKRALSSRRHSESSVLPRSQSSARSNTVPSRHQSMIEHAPDHSLHPFWRPRSFWDDLSDDSDSDSEFGNSGVLVGSYMHVTPRPQRQEMLSSGQPFAGWVSRTSSLSRRLTSSLGLSKSEKYPGRAQMRRWSSTSSRNPIHHNHQSAHPILESNRCGRNQRAETVSLHESKLSLIKLKTFTRRIEKAIHQREEGKREKMRERLRESIDVIRGDRIGEPGNFFKEPEELRS